MGTQIALGMLVGLGFCLVAIGVMRAPVRLDDALALLDRSPSRISSFPASQQRRFRLPLTEAQQRLLNRQGRDVDDFFLEKMIFTATGLFLPGLWIVMQLILGNPLSTLPFALSPIGAVIGFFVPDVLLRRGASKQQRAVNESVHTFFDLVALERLANASATQATASAAGISEAPLFRRITMGLERARMEQVPPWDELRAIAKEWNVPELSDFADIMRMEDQGAGLASILQARVKELRDAHLNKVKQRAAEASEQMTIWMTIPAMLLAIAFLTPALLRMTTL